MRREISNSGAIAARLTEVNAGHKITFFDADVEKLYPQIAADSANSNLSYTGRIKTLVAKWRLNSGAIMDRFTQPGGLITPRTAEFLSQGRILSIWISTGAAQPIKLGELLLLRIDGYRWQQLNLIDFLGEIPLGRDTTLYAQIENTGGGLLAPGDEVVISGAWEEAIAYEDNREFLLEAKLDTILAKLNNLQISGGGTIAEAAAMTEILLRDAAWTFQWWSGAVIWRTTPESATGKLRLGYLKLKTKLHLSIAGGLDSSQGPLKFVRIRAKEDNALLVERTGFQLIGYTTNELRPTSIDTSAHTDAEVYLEFEDTDAGNAWAWFAIGNSFWVE